jgi:RNA polymerase sigma factor (TIGR02999 family)
MQRSGMNADRQQEVTGLLNAWMRGDAKALEQLTPLIYVELRNIARGYMARERNDLTLQPTALANEAYIRLMGDSRSDWKDRTHFFAACAQIMRRILIEAARGRMTGKRGGQAVHVVLNEQLAASVEQGAELLALDDALAHLERSDPRKARVVELRFFGGLTVEETAAVLEISPQSVMRDWKLAKAWLLVELKGGSPT